MVANVNQPLAASLFPYGGGRLSGDGIVRSGFNPETVSPPLGRYDPEASFPGLSAGLVSALLHYGGLREAGPFRLIGPTPARPVRELLDPQRVRTLVEESPLDLPSDWPWRSTPVDQSLPARPSALPQLQTWAEDVEAMLADRSAVFLPETHPGTSRAGFAETHEVAAIVAGLVDAARAAQDPARRDRWLALAARVVGFYRGATSDGARPVLSSYRTRTGAQLAFSDEFRLPAIAIPTARANVALASTVLELARATGDPETWRFACRLTARVLEFVPDADPLWPRNTVPETDAPHHAELLAKRLWAAWGAGASSPRQLDIEKIMTRARVALASGQLSPPFQELLREMVLTDPPRDSTSSKAGGMLARQLIARAFVQGRVALGREIAETGPAHVGTPPGEVTRSDVVRVLEVALGENNRDRDRLVHWFRACGGLCEHHPRTAVGLPAAGLTLSPETDRYELPSNADALEFFSTMTKALEAGPRRDPEEQRLYRDLVVARSRLADWFRFIILPVVARGRGHAPSHWRQQRWITGVVPTGIEGSAEPHVILPNRWTTLESSVAAARAALAVDPANTEMVREWLTNLLKVYGSFAPAGDVMISGMSFAPETFVRYEGPLYAAALTLEYAVLSARASYEPGRRFAEASLATFLVRDTATGHNRVLTAAGPGPFPRGEGIETGDGRTLYTEATARGVFGWSPVATLLAAKGEFQVPAKPKAHDSSDRLAACRIASRNETAPGWLSPSAAPREQFVCFLGSLAALIAVAAAGLVVPWLDVRQRRRPARGPDRLGRANSPVATARRWGLSRVSLPALPRHERG